ncbi:hypothetical protein J7443_04530 [Tropicibacter sp. R15_0]|uniref:hypothetical protein n=1 Tax=Tropicibacter sp. R15_0 TaxID=2821101 RepID=UPI001ADC3387|nr:hypothetical protein [Tropicibacter sp. R15_0]MBO9464488.1 hypothetical protein [Tropicibacter sp. R15_0]
MRFIPILVALALPASALADGFCEVTDKQDILARLAGEWQREGTMVIDNAVTEIVKPSSDYLVTLSADGTGTSDFVDNLLGAAQDLRLADPRPYDVDRVDDVLDSTDRFDLADILSDTKCGPENLPQLVMDLPETKGMSATGTITYIAYFDDRILELSELTLKSDETVLFLTETALLTRADSAAKAKEE